MFEESPPGNICVIRLSAIGDTCHALAVIRAIQDRWPECRITWIIGKTEAGLMSDIPDIEFIIFDKRKGIGAYPDARRQLGNRTFDVALCMHASLRANWLCRLVDAPVRIGFDYRRARDFQWLFTNRRIAAVPKEHALDAMMGFARALGVRKENLRWDIPLAKVDLEFAAKHIASGQPHLLISPCSSQRARNFRNWSIDNYIAAARFAQKEFDCKIILTGGSSELELEYGNAIARQCQPGIVNLIGQTSLKQLLALIRASTAVLCPDSGPAHMATAVNVPVIGLYATSNPARTGPYLSPELTINAYPEAVQQYLGKTIDEVAWGQRVRDAGAMDLIKLSCVKSAIERAFQVS